VRTVVTLHNALPDREYDRDAVEIPVTRYATNSDGDSIAYQVLGEGELDIVFVPGFISHVELFWVEPAVARFYRRLAEFARLIIFDKRGTGLSDPVSGALPLEERMEDVHAVMDAAGSEGAALIGLSEGAPMASLFAATYPDRTVALVLCGSIIGGSADEHPAGQKWDECCRRLQAALEGWGTGSTLRLLAPSSEATDRQLGMMERAGASPRMAKAVMSMWIQTDIRDILPSVAAPTLVLHRSDEIFPVEAARVIAQLIPGAVLVELPGEDHVPSAGDYEAYLAEITEFLTGTRERSGRDRVLTTILVTDIVGSTDRAAALGGTAWRDLIARHDDLVRREIRRFDGQEVKHTGDGFLARFDGPARGIHCARAVADSAPEELGIEIRAGVHTGECELSGSDLRGLAVHIAARVASQASPGEVLVSSTVTELVLGSGIQFEDRGIHELKGVPGAWRIYAVGRGQETKPRHYDAPEPRPADKAGVALARRAPRLAQAVVRAERSLARVATRRKRGRD